MNKTTIRKSAVAALFLCTAIGLHAQDTTPSKPKRAWELGIGASAWKISRFSILNTTPIPAAQGGGYNVQTSKRDLLFGGGIYVARELNRFLYLDLQASAGYTHDPVRGGKEHRMLYMGGLGLQWRWGAHLNSRYIDPYFRVGMNYMYKNFDINYQGRESLEADKQLGWDMQNSYNKDGADRRHLMPVALGAGVNMWVTDRFGIGLQADYLLMPYKRVADQVQGNVRLLWRIGGESKKPRPVVQTEYVERVVERIVEKPVVVEKIVEKNTVDERELLAWFENIYFAFDKDELTPRSQEIVQKIARLMKLDTTRRYLITGFTDTRGSHAYNEKLSERRANTVRKALIEQGVPAEMLKSVGVGKRAALMPYHETHEVRRGDRKITVEYIDNMEYWNKL